MLYDIRGVKVDFPYEAYECQRVYMEKVIQALQEGRNALLESPTGTGKTLCLLCSTLAWRRYIDQQQIAGNDTEPFTSQLAGPPVTIIYASRTHSQLTQVVRELKKTSYGFSCSNVHTPYCKQCEREVTRLSMVSTRKCQFYNSVDQYKTHSEFSETICDIEDMVKLGQKHETCPYYLSKELQGNADIIFMPYNYLVDPAVRKGLTVSLPGSVLIFDEAHNLEGTCSEAASFDFSDGELASCVREVQEAIDISLRPGYGGGTGGSDGVSAEELAQLKALLLKLEEAIDSVKLEDGGLSGRGFTRDGTYIYQFLAEIGITFETQVPLVKLIEDVVALITAESSGHNTIALGQFNSHLRSLFKFPLSYPDHPSHYYKVHIHSDKNRNRNFSANFYGKSNTKPGKEGRTLSYWCFNPGVAMQELQQAGVRSIILTSGTLSPMESFAYELKTPFPVQLENSHVVGNGQVWVGVVSKGPSGKPLNSSFQNRDNDSYKSDLGNAIVNYARIVPNGLLVFFPSYGVLSEALDFWKLPTANSATTIWERICSHKQPVVEPRESHQFSHAMDDFYQKVKDPNKVGGGAIFFAVCRGKVSEGLDFADQNGRAVIITGLPYPALNDAKIKLKREYLDSSKQSENAYVLRGGEWYTQQASRAVNQAVGRVIRHRADYGAIILCDERFSHRSSQDQLSKWLRPHMKVYNQFGESTMALIQFFRNVTKTVESVLEKKASSSAQITNSNSLNVSPNVNNNNTATAITPAPGPKPTNSTSQATSRNNLDSIKKDHVQDSLLTKIGTSTTTNTSARTGSTSKLSEQLKREPKNKDVRAFISPFKADDSKKQPTTTPASTKIPPQKLTSPPADSAEQHRRQFNELAKRELSAAGYTRFHEILRALRDRIIKLDTAVMQVNELAAGNKYLMEQFIPFIPSARQEKYRLLLLGPDPTSNNSSTPSDTVSNTAHTRTTSTTSTSNTTNMANTTTTNTTTTNTTNMANAPTTNATTTKENTTSTDTNEMEKNEDNEGPESPKRSVQQYDLISGQPAKKKPKLNTRPALTNSATTEDTADNQADKPQQSIPDPDPMPTEASTTVGCVCSICHSKATSPFSAKCGHICCHACWASWLKEKLECPVCRVKTRQKQLTKLYFL